MEKILNANEIIKLFSINALGGRKIPHGVSNPVFHKNEKGDIVVSSFIFTYTADELRNRSVHRPSKWMTVDIKSGCVISKYECTEKDFCDIPFETNCSLESAPDANHSMEYQNKALTIFDLIIKKYIEFGVFDKNLNHTYMRMVLNVSPVGFKDFYKALNNV